MKGDRGLDQKQKTSLTGTVLVLLAGISWGASGLYVRFFTALGLSSMQLTFFKCAIPAVVLMLYCLVFRRDALRVRLKDLWIFVCLGVISLTFFTWCYFSTIEAASMSAAAILLYLAPSLVMLMSAVLFKETVTKTKLLACLMAFAGCFFVSGIVGDAGPLPARAIVTGLLSALTYALYSIFGQLAMNRGYDPLTLPTYAFTFGALSALPLFRPGEVAAAAVGTSPLKFWVLLVLMTFTCALLPYLLYSNGLKRSTPARASIMASIEPVTATVLGALVFHEWPDVFGYLGIALVIGAIVLLNINTTKKASSE